MNLHRFCEDASCFWGMAALLLCATSCGPQVGAPDLNAPAAQKSSSAMQKPSAGPVETSRASQRPEASKQPVRIVHSGRALSLVPKDGFEYLDGQSMAGGSDISSIDRVSQWLYDSKFKCVHTLRISWNGETATANDKYFGTKRVIIECHGDCRDVHYTVSARSLLAVVIDHFGLSQPIPVLQFQGPSLGAYNVQWTFTRTNAADNNPRISLHSWTNDFGDYGGGCRFEK